MHNVRVDQIEQTQIKAKDDPKAAMIEVAIGGEWNAGESEVQFAGPLKFVAGETMMQADFPPFLGGEGRAPSPLGYCFYGAMCCYASTFATQAAMAGIELQALRIRLNLSVDFRAALGVGDFPPLGEFDFQVEVETGADADAVEKVKQLTDERCPAIWAMRNQVEFKTAATKV